MNLSEGVERAMRGLNDQVDRACADLIASPGVTVESRHCGLCGQEAHVWVGSQSGDHVVIVHSPPSTLGTGSWPDRVHLKVEQTIGFARCADLRHDSAARYSAPMTLVVLKHPASWGWQKLDNGDGPGHGQPEVVASDHGTSWDLETAVASAFSANPETTELVVRRPADGQF